MTEFAEGCFMDPRYNTYERSTKPLPVCICKGDYCNTQERIENIWLEQKIYEFHDPEDCDNQMIKEKSATTAGTVTSASTVPLTTAVSSLSTVTSETRAVSANISDSTQPESSASLETQAYTKQESLLVTTAKSELAVTEVEAERTTINSSILRSSFPDVPNDLFTAPGKADDTTIISNYLTTATIITHPNNDTVVAGTNNTTDTVESATSMNDTVTTVTTAATITTVIMTINANTTVNTTEIAN
uniref:Uncharacterized protein n=1 Tax=Setaria digitata TaxID=48799 RepID=A0A915PFI2_9BILA